MDDAILAVDIHAAEVYNLSIEQGTKRQSLPKDYQTPPIRFKKWKTTKNSSGVWL